jgi:site-specific DNA-methyltransferase (adenine-specific)
MAPPVFLVTGDCREVMPAHGPYDCLVMDPPYGDTSLTWDRRVAGWLELARASLSPTGSMWVFGSMRFFMGHGAGFREAGWRYAQDLVWEKHNGSSLHNDRFKRVHEHAVQFYRDDAEWSKVYNDVQTTSDATPRTVRRKSRPPHTGLGRIGETHYVSEDGGPRIMRSVVPMRSCHGRAIHPTEKPAALMEILVRTSCPPGGLVGDWFAGSGSVGEACQMTGRRYVGCEIDPDMAEKARYRLASTLFGAAASA